MTQILETDRLILSEFETDDAAFVRELLNEPAWIEYIGDRGIQTDEDAEAYIVGKLRPSYTTHGFGFYVCRLRSDPEPVGICGIVKRESLEDVDLGFAFLERHWGKGYAREASEGVIRFARETVGLSRLIAITNQANQASIGLLKRLGMKPEGLVRLDIEKEELNLFSLSL